VFFPFMRMLDAYIGLYAIPAAWLSRSSGRWKSPARRAVDTGDLAGRAPVRDGSALGPDLHSPARMAEVSHVSG
jgi:hypothetical protein